MLHGFDRYAMLLSDISGSANSRTRVTGCRLNEQLFHLGPSDNFLIQFDVECSTTGKGNATALSNNLAQIVIHKAERHFFEQFLERGSVVNVGIISNIPLSTWPQPFD